jgi:hypothetical protein
MSSLSLAVRALLVALLVACLGSTYQVVHAVSANTCSAEMAGSGSCVIDGFIGSEVIYEDASYRIWNFTLLPGEMTSMHSHDCAYHFVAVTPTILEVFGEESKVTGQSLFSFEAKPTTTTGFAGMASSFTIRTNAILNSMNSPKITANYSITNISQSPPVVSEPSTS